MTTDNLPPIEDDENGSAFEETVQSDPQRTQPQSRILPTQHISSVGNDSEQTRPGMPVDAQSRPIGDTTGVSVPYQNQNQNQRPPANPQTSPPQQHRARQSVYRPVPTRPPHSPRDSSLYLPWWSLVLMLVGVLVMAFIIVMLAMSLGGNAPLTEPAPIVRVVTGEATFATLPSGSSAATATPGSRTITGGEAPATMAMSGPELTPVVFTPTPQRIQVGSQVAVDGVGANKLNVRDNPGSIGTSVLFRADEGTLFEVIDGPSQADGFTWWRIQAVNNPSQAGWAASNYLIIPPADS